MLCNKPQLLPPPPLQVVDIAVVLQSTLSSSNIFPAAPMPETNPEYTLKPCVAKPSDGGNRRCAFMTVLLLSRLSAPCMPEHSCICARSLRGRGSGSLARESGHKSKVTLYALSYHCSRVHAYTRISAFAWITSLRSWL